MTTNAPAFPVEDLPAYPDAELAELGADELIDLLVAEEDLAPRNLIDAAAAKGDAMIAELRRRVAGPWRAEENDDEDGDLGEWWLRLHAAMIAGLVPGEDAGMLLCDLLEWIEAAGDDDLQGWLAGHWPALLANKPESAVARMRELSAAAARDWYSRINALEPVVARAARQGSAALDEALDGVARVAADEDEDWDMRLSCGNTLLDFPRPRHRPLLEELARRQGNLGVAFSLDDVRRAFASAVDDPHWQRHADPWTFYDPAAIAHRQVRWATERAGPGDDDGEEGGPDDATLDAGPYAAVESSVESYVRAGPKIGRNDPCPCGSGKKYKKCCLPKSAA